jgi:hypothetical protein
LVDGTLYIGVYAFENVDTGYSVTIQSYSCFANCNGAHGTCAPATGVCTCSAGWDALPDCSAATATATPGTAYTADLAARSTEVYLVNVDANQPYSELFLDSYCASGCDVSSRLYVLTANGRIPTDTDNDGNSNNLYSPSQHSAITAKSPIPGKWYVVITNLSANKFTVGFQAQLRVCPGSCNGAGSCNSTTLQCTCNPGHQGADCSIDTITMDPTVPRNDTLQAYDNNVYQVTVSPLFAKSEVEMVFNISQLTTGSNINIVNAYLKFGSVPTSTDYQYSSSLPLTSTQFIRVSITDLTAGDYFLYVVNRNQVPVSYAVTMKYDAFCDAACPLHGTCDQYGDCQCNAGYAGSDCSLSLDEIAAASCYGTSVGATVGIVLISFALAFAFVWLGLTYCINKDGLTPYASSSAALNATSLEDESGYVPPSTASYAQLKDVSIN